MITNGAPVERVSNGALVVRVSNGAPVERVLNGAPVELVYQTESRRWPILAHIRFSLLLQHRSFDEVNKTCFDRVHSSANRVKMDLPRRSFCENILEIKMRYAMADFPSTLG